MIKRIDKLSYYQKQVILGQVRQYEQGENIDVQLIWNGEYHEIQADEITYLGYKCECGALIADYEDYTGRDIDTDRCPKCNAHYDYTEQELAEL